MFFNLPNYYEYRRVVTQRKTVALIRPETGKNDAGRRVFIFDASRFLSHFLSRTSYIRHVDDVIQTRVRRPCLISTETNTRTETLLEVHRFVFAERERVRVVSVVTIIENIQPSNIHRVSAELR